MDFKDLHDPSKAAELLKEFKQSFKTKVCLSPYPNSDCNGKIISAHTLSVSSMLRPISRNSHVYSLKVNLPPKQGEKPALIELCGINDTSVFNGFCQKHDKELFAPIEDKPFICSKEQLFLHAYRAVAKESYLKRKQAESLPTPEEIQKIHGLGEELVYSRNAILYQIGSLRGAIDIENLKSRMDSYLLNEDYGRLVTEVIEFECQPPISTSFPYSPDIDFDGNPLQSFEDHTQDLSQIIITILPSNNGGFLLLSYEDTANSAPSNLCKSLLQQGDISSSIAWLVALQTENFAISPSWYESLPLDQRDNFEKAFYSNVDLSELSINNLQNLNLQISDWKMKHHFKL